MVKECTTKIHPVFAKIITPPCIKNEKFISCLYDKDNDRRYRGEDHLPPCSLWLYHENRGRPYPIDRDAFESREAELDHHGWTREQFLHMVDRYRSFWRRDPFSGKLL